MPNSTINAPDPAVKEGPVFNFFKRLSNHVGRYMALYAILVTLLAYFVRGSFSSFMGNPDFLGGQLNVTNLLMVIMFGMGMTLRFEDFMVVFTEPRDMLAGEVAQFLVMPLTGFLLCLVFQLPPELAVGVILTGCCPGGTASNVMTYMARGDVALSVGMTATATVLAPLLTPLLTLFYTGLYSESIEGSDIHVDAMGMFVGIIKIVIIPIALGMLLNRFFRRFTAKLTDGLPLISCIGICLIIGFVIDKTGERLLDNGLIIILVVILHNLIGYLMGFGVGWFLRLPAPRRNAITIEVGMQNSGLATALAASCFPAMILAQVPGAIFSAWHNISGAIAAGLMARSVPPENADPAPENRQKE